LEKRDKKIYAWEFDEGLGLGRQKKVVSESGRRGKIP
jgi:hypothetical protein